MRKILFSACCSTYIQHKACEGLIELLENGSYQVDMAGKVDKDSWSSYNLAFAFNKKGYEKIRTLHPTIPIVYSIMADDYEKEFIEDATQYVHLLLIVPEKNHCCGDHVTGLRFPCIERMNTLPKYQHSIPSILVGSGNGHSALRVFILLNTLLQYRVNIIYSGEQELCGIGYASHVSVREEYEVDTLIQNANLIIGSKYVALQGALQRKPVLIIGEFGSGGLLTLDNVVEQYHNNFLGEIGGKPDGYFSLDQFQREIKTASKLSSRELEAISGKLKKEILENNKQVWNLVSSYFVIPNA